MTLTELRAAAAHYEWLERRLFEVLGGWVPTVAEPDVKLMLRRHSFQHAGHADLWAQLGSPGRVHRAGPAALGRVLDAVEAPTGTVERLAGAYGVVLPALASAYRELAAGGAGAGSPLRRVLTLVLADDEAAVAEGAQRLQGLSDEATGGAHQSALEDLLVDSGGVKPPETC